MRTTLYFVVLGLSAFASACSAADNQREESEPAADPQALKAIGVDVSVIATRPRPPIGPIVPPIVVITDPVPDADLRPEGAMRYYGPAQPNLGLQTDVINQGTTPAIGAAGRVVVAGMTLNAALYQYYGGTASGANTVNPGERGYLLVQIPPNVLFPCSSYPVQIDLDHTMQSGSNPFANDSVNALAYETGVTCKLNWSTPMNAATLGTAPPPAQGGKFIAGHSLQEMVSSTVSGRADGLMCSHCHNSSAGTNFLYRPAIAPDSVQASPMMDPFQFVSGSDGWACGGNPWGAQLASTSYPKPQYLRDAFTKWLHDGGMR